jgi:hypothetical protein
LDIIDSVKYLHEDIRLNISIIIFGKATVSFDQLIKQKIKDVTANFKVSIIYENAHVANDRLKSIFEQTDFILMPYKNSESSSGILGHAVVNKKLVIGPVAGLLGFLIKENKLGFLLDPVNAVSIAAAITDCFYLSPPEYREDKIRNAFLSTHTSDIFANIILSQLQS